MRNRKLTLNPVEALARFGVSADAIRDVVVTHLHYDHAGNLDLFPNARFHLQDREMSYATGRCMCFGALRHPFSVEHVTLMVRHVFSERVTFHSGDGEVAPGVTLHRVGGHSDGLQVVRVETARGPVVLASDAAHYYGNLHRRSPFPIVYNIGDMCQGWEIVERLAGHPDRIIPGHDPIVQRSTRAPATRSMPSPCTRRRRARSRNPYREISWRETAMIKRFPGLTPTRSRAVVHDDLVFTVAVAPDPVTSSMYEQSAKALERIDESLALCGTDKSKISLGHRLHHRHDSGRAEMNRAWDEWVDATNPPMRACIGVDLEPPHIVEIVVTAAK